MSVLRHSDIVLFIQITNDQEGLKYEKIWTREQIPYSETYDKLSLVEKKTNNEPKILEKLWFDDGGGTMKEQLDDNYLETQVVYPNCSSGHKRQMLATLLESLARLKPTTSTHKQRGGWDIVGGGLKGGSPPVNFFANSDSDFESEVEEPLDFFADSDSNSSCDSETDDKTSERSPVVEKLKPLPSVIFTRTVETVDLPTERFSKCGCDNNCSETAEKMGTAGVEAMKQRFVGDNLTETKNILLNYMFAQSDMLIESECGFVYKGHTFCIDAFSHITGTSKFILRKVLDYHNRGIEKFTHGNTQMAKFSSKKVKAMCWFKTFCDLFGQCAPDDPLVVLPSFLTPTILFEIYKDENECPSERIQFSTFCRMIKSDFGSRRINRILPWVRLSKHSSHSRCETCCDLDAFQRICRSQLDIDLCKALKYKHKERYGRQRLCINQIKQMSVSQPEQYLSIYLGKPS